MATSKDTLRRDLLRSRRGVSEREHAAEAKSLATHLLALDLPGTVCAYVPVGTEPGSLDALDELHRRGVRVLLPVAQIDADGTPLALSWGVYQPGELVGARFGLREPVAPHLPPEAVHDADVVLVPALAVDRRGVRLGRGAGFYDRSLPLRNPAARLIAVVRDDEMRDELPAEAHDIRMTHALTPGNGLMALN